MISVDEINKLKEIIDNKNNTIAVLEDANTKIKEAYKKLNSLYFDNCEYTGRLERALEKIKEIALSHDSVSCAGLFECSNCKDKITDNGKTCNEKGRLLILQIISECEGENE